ncbi:hypothetical protein OAO01_04115, partial [Oligoflexia bacterium]|nr:hypothetical protein [Oligoflexia bacterium]
MRKRSILAANENPVRTYVTESKLVGGKGLIGPYSLCGEYLLSLRGILARQPKCRHFDWRPVYI